MAYVVENQMAAATDFADGAQRFTWCSCRTPEQLASGLRGLGLGAMFDFEFWNQDVFGAPAPVPAPAPAPASSGFSLPSLPFSWWWLAGGLVVAFLLFSRSGGRRRRR